MGGLCWWCCHEIPGESIGLPYELKNNQFKTLVAEQRRYKM